VGRGRCIQPVRIEAFGTHHRGVGMGSGLTTPGGGETFPYAGTPVHVLAGRDGGPWAAAELVVPPLFRGPVPHVHDTFDEALYIIDGVLMVATGHDEPVEAPTGAFHGAAGYPPRPSATRRTGPPGSSDYGHRPATGWTLSAPSDGCSPPPAHPTARLYVRSTNNTTATWSRTNGRSRTSSAAAPASTTGFPSWRPISLVRR
jgi:hypothetical protein